LEYRGQGVLFQFDARWLRMVKTGLVKVLGAQYRISVDIFYAGIGAVCPNFSGLWVSWKSVKTTIWRWTLHDNSGFKNLLEVFYTWFKLPFCVTAIFSFANSVHFLDRQNNLFFILIFAE
jgi:hypothetical protein